MLHVIFIRRIGSDIMTTTDNDIAIEVLNLKKYFPVQAGFLASLFKRSENKFVHAVDDVSFSIKK